VEDKTAGRGFGEGFLPGKAEELVRGAGEVQFLPVEGEAFINDVDLKGLSHGKVAEEGEEKIVTATGRDDFNGGRKSGLYKRLPEQMFDRGGPDFRKVDLAALTEVAKDGIGEIKEALAADEGGGGLRFLPRGSLEVAAELCVGPLEKGQDPFDKDFASGTRLDGHAFGIDDAVCPGPPFAEAGQGTPVSGFEST